MVDFSAPPEVYALALVPAVLWGFSPVLSKRGMSEGGHAIQAACVVVVVDSVLYWAALLLRQGTDVFAGLTPFALGLFVAAGLFGTAAGRVAVFMGVERVGASINSAAISTRPLFAGLLAIAFLGERVTLPTVAGVVVLAVGLAVLSLGRGGDLSGWKRRHLAYPLAAALLFAAGNVARRYGLQFTDVTVLEAVTVNETAALVALGAFALAARGRGVFERPRSTYLYFAGSGTITAVALLSLFTALSLPAGRVVVVDPLAASAPLFTAVFAYFLLDDLERVTASVAGGALLVVVGAALVTVG